MDDELKKGPIRKGRRKIEIKFISDKSRRHITFSKRKAGIMKKAYELATLTGTQVLLLVASETGHVYTFATPRLQPLITEPEGKNLIQSCLNSNEGDVPGIIEDGSPPSPSSGNGQSMTMYNHQEEEPPSPPQQPQQTSSTTVSPQIQQPQQNFSGQIQSSGPVPQSPPHNEQPYQHPHQHQHHHQHQHQHQNQHQHQQHQNQHHQHQHMHQHGLPPHFHQHHQHPQFPSLYPGIKREPMPDGFMSQRMPKYEMDFPPGISTGTNPAVLDDDEGEDDDDDDVNGPDANPYLPLPPMNFPRQGSHPNMAGGYYSHHHHHHHYMNSNYFLPPQHQHQHAHGYMPPPRQGSINLPSNMMPGPQPHDNV